MKYTIPQGEGGERNRAKYQKYTSEGGRLGRRGGEGWLLSFGLALSKGNRRDAKGKHRWVRRSGKSEGEGWRNEKAR